MAESATGIERTELCPTLPPDFAGIQIVAAPRPRRASPIVLHGTYRIPWPDADPIAPSRHRALVLVATAGGRHVAVAPFRERVLFEDDEQETRTGALGHFTLDVSEILGLSDPGEYFLHVSLGTHVSNVVRVKVD